MCRVHGVADTRLRFKPQNERVQEVRSRTDKTVRAAMDTLSNDELRNRVRRAAESTDEYVRERPWAMIGAAAGVGLLIGLLLRRD